MTFGEYFYTGLAVVSIVLIIVSSIGLYICDRYEKKDCAQICHNGKLEDLYRSRVCLCKNEKGNFVIKRVY